MNNGYIQMSSVTTLPRETKAAIGPGMTLPEMFPEGTTAPETTAATTAAPTTAAPTTAAPTTVAATTEAPTTEAPATAAETSAAEAETSASAEAATEAQTTEAVPTESAIPETVEETAAPETVQAPVSGSGFPGLPTGETQTGTLVPGLPVKLKENPSLFTGIAIAGVVLLGGLAAMLLRKRKGAGSVGDEVVCCTECEASGTTIHTARGGVRTLRVGKLHNIGRRDYQQDCFAFTPISNGLLAVVADGMGGLKDGDKVSQKIVMTMLQDAPKYAGQQPGSRLMQMLSHANEEVNRMLGRSNQYRSGSTTVAVLVDQGVFEWISVGDSRIYLYRNQKLIQLNREHTYEADLIQKAVNGEISFREAQTDPQRNKLTSFVGMGQLKHIDGSVRPVAYQAGDRLLLMSDGVFNTLSENEMIEILQKHEDPEQAAAAMEQAVLAYQHPRQDNFTAVIVQLS